MVEPASETPRTRWLSVYVLLLFLSSLGAVDMAAHAIVINPVIFAVAVVFSAFLALTAFGLLRRRRWGWVANWVLLGFLGIATIAEFSAWLVFALLMKVANMAYAMVLLFLVFGAGFLWPNYVYFRKRGQLFT
jgi:lysylphosphatidylglycerol synthetase-like protein (DUF2156 family)